MPNAKKQTEKAKRENRSGARLRAVRMFTDRDDLRTAYHRLVERAAAEDFEDCYVISYYGVGGVGKSTLLEKLRSEVEERAKNDWHRHICLMLDFDKVEADAVPALEHLKAQLQEQKFSFPLFELALYALYQKSGRVLDRKAREDLFAKNPLLDAVLSTSQALPVVGMVATLGRNAVKLAGSVRDVVRDALDNHKGSLYQIEQMDSNALLKNLPRLFAEDVNGQLENDTMLHIFIDTYEKLVSVAEGQRRDHTAIGNDTWLYGEGGLVRELGNAVFAIGGREKLHWPETSEFWEKRLEAHLTDHLSEEDSSRFLDSCGVPQELWRPLYELTGGEPVFLDLCVDRYEELEDEGRTPEAEDFGRDVETLVERHTRYLPENLLDAVYLMAGMRRWDRETFDLAARSAGITVNPSEYSEKLTHLSYVTDEGNGVFSMHQVIARILASKLPDELAAAASKALSTHVTAVMEPAPDEKERVSAPAAADLALRAAANLAGEQAGTEELASALEKQAAAACDKLQFSQAVEKQRQAVDIYLGQHGPEHPDTLKAQEDLIEYYDRLGKYDRARELAEQVYEAQRRVLGSEAPDTLRSLGNLAFYCYKEGKYGRARELAEQAYEAQCRVLGPEHPDTLQTQETLAIISSEMGDHGRACELAEQVYEARRRIFGPEHRDTLVAQHYLAAYYSRRGDYGRARELEEQVCEAWSRIFGPEHPDTLQTQETLAIYYDDLGDHARARELTEKVYEAQCRILGPEHPNTLRSLYQLSTCCGKMGDYDRARELAEQAYEAQCRILGPEHPDTLCALTGLTNDYSNLGDYGRAYELGEQVYEAWSRLYGPEHPNTLLAQHDLAVACSKLGDYGRARELEEQVYEAWSRLYGPEHPNTLLAQHNLVIYCGNLGDYDRAYELAEQVYEARCRVLGPEHPDTLLARHNLAVACSKLGDYGRACRLEEQTYEARRRVLGPEHRDTLWSQYHLSIYSGKMGDYGQARELHEQVYKTVCRVSGPVHPDMLTLIEKLADSYKTSGRLLRARKLRKKLEELRRDGPKRSDKE